MRSRYC